MIKRKNKKAKIYKYKYKLIPKEPVTHLMNKKEKFTRFKKNNKESLSLSLRVLDDWANMQPAIPDVIGN